MKVPIILQMSEDIWSRGLSHDLVRAHPCEPKVVQ